MLKLSPKHCKFLHDPEGMCFKYSTDLDFGRFNFLGLMGQNSFQFLFNIQFSAQQI